MEDLGAVLLDGIHFDHMGRTLPWVLTEGTKHSDQFIVHINTDDRQYIQNEARYNTKAQSCRAEISSYPVWCKMYRGFTNLEANIQNLYSSWSNSISSIWTSFSSSKQTFLLLLHSWTLRTLVTNQVTCKRLVTWNLLLWFLTCASPAASAGSHYSADFLAASPGSAERVPSNRDWVGTSL